MRVFCRAVGALLDRRFVGRVFGGYTLEKVLGQGRFATCFLARPKRPESVAAFGRTASFEPSFSTSRDSVIPSPGLPEASFSNPSSVVMKLVKPREGRMDAEAIWAECSALQACDHPAIPRWLGIVNADAPGRAFGERPRMRRAPYFIVEEFMPGSSLAFWLRKQRHVFGMQEIRSIGLQLLDALEHLEQRGIVHGDLRPANILYDGERVSLIDFGLSERIGFLFAKGANGGFASVFDDGFVVAPDIASPAEASPADPFFADRDGFASILLFLLYSDASRVKPGVQGSWREELELPLALRQLLEDLFDEDHPWTAYAEVRKRFLDAFV